MESSDKTWSTGEGNGKPLQYSCLENPMNSMKRQKDRTLKDELPRLVGGQYATGEEGRNNSRENEEMESKQKQHPVMNVTGDRSNVQCCKEQYCIGTWNVRSMNQGKLEVVKKETARVNIDILGISKLKWTGMTNLNSILKSRDITLLRKICIIKAMVLPVAMYGCESWAIKKAEHRRTNAFKLWC